MQQFSKIIVFRDMKSSTIKILLHFHYEYPISIGVSMYNHRICYTDVLDRITIISFSTNQTVSLVLKSVSIIAITRYDQGFRFVLIYTFSLESTNGKFHLEIFH